jgi:hypothetical protein
MSKFYEDEEDMRLRILMEKAPKIMASYKEGDVILLHAGQDDEEMELDETPSAYELIDLENILSQRRYNTFCNMDFEENNEVFFINRLYKVTDVENGIPLVIRLNFPKEDRVGTYPDSLLTLLYYFVERRTDNYEDYETIIKQVDNFAKLDDDFADSILLESSYTPYSRDMEKLEDFIIKIDIETTKQRKFAAKIRRAQKRGEEREIKEEFFYEINKVLRKVYKE